MVVVRDVTAFQARYGTAPVIAGTYAGALDNAGEHLLLVDEDGATIQDFTYDDSDLDQGWHPTTDGDGFSLVIADPHGALAKWSVGGGWRPSHELGGSPGELDLIRGDFDADDRVGVSDLAYLQSRLGTVAGATTRTGDLTGDGAVTRADVAVMARNFGRSYVPAGSGSSPTAPMPAAAPATAPAASAAVVARPVARDPQAATADMRGTQPERGLDRTEEKNQGAAAPAPRTAKGAAGRTLGSAAVDRAIRDWNELPATSTLSKNHGRLLRARRLAPSIYDRLPKSIGRMGDISSVE
jgi:hypothetical protein